MSYVRPPVHPEIWKFEPIPHNDRVFIPVTVEKTNAFCRPIGFERSSEIVVVSDIDDFSFTKREER
ncbi:hypothetical protein EHQ12_04190 [Leptospira gomenensis]|uniref:Uncharacterized protein n=1 Tax=Leptospira gomenensis TaxID=2484974 RepID=A0A5F1YHU7_9LEPT|nr:hypothetical protein EHQ17_04525 [Leptospira gomenensis]TGK42776.1 hypothetical protein EHQ07_13965 [Leptospira gomenensis]TGK42965.1 hypothetical protein EHQ12_04190 [Leptospira gomenensis]TGK54976.1 hypothetical protein EHQ13_18445 [Leptospira gomenensis]